MPYTEFSFVRADANCAVCRAGAPNHPASIVILDLPSGAHRVLKKETDQSRSPLYRADQLSKPVIFFQGAEDAIVPPNQAEALVEALRRKGKPVGYLLFSGEQHGFRKAATIQHCLDAELQFYAIEVFKISLTF